MLRKGWCLYNTALTKIEITNINTQIPIIHVSLEELLSFLIQLLETLVSLYIFVSLKSQLFNTEALYELTKAMHCIKCSGTLYLQIQSHYVQACVGFVTGRRN